jgi:hypothetical protein
MAAICGIGYGGPPFGITVMYLVTHSCGYANSRIQFKSKSSIVVSMLSRCSGIEEEDSG